MDSSINNDKANQCCLFPALVNYATPAEYKEHYEKYYCRQKIITFDNLRVYFRKTKFGHVFYESSSRDGRKDVFSRRRAERIDWIKATLEHPKAEFYQGWNKDKKVHDCDRRVSVVYEDFVVVIQIKRDINEQIIAAEFVTAYSADNSIAKIRSSPKWDFTIGEKK